MECTFIKHQQILACALQRSYLILIKPSMFILVFLYFNIIIWKRKKLSFENKIVIVIGNGNTES